MQPLTDSVGTDCNAQRSLDGRSIFFTRRSSQNTKYLYRFDLVTQQATRFLSDKVLAFAVSFDGSALAFSTEKELHIVDAQTGSTLRTEVIPGYLFDVQYRNGFYLIWSVG